MSHARKLGRPAGQGGGPGGGWILVEPGIRGPAAAIDLSRWWRDLPPGPAEDDEAP